MDDVALVVGEALVDVVRGRDGRDRDHAGGSSANAAVAMSRLGREVWFAGAWADDAHGALLAGHLADNAVRLAGDPVVLERTATAVATLAEDGSASYVFDIEWRVPDGAAAPARRPGRGRLRLPRRGARARGRRRARPGGAAPGRAR